MKKVPIYLFIVICLGLLNCSTLSKTHIDRLSSTCSEYFNECGNQNSIPECDTLIAKKSTWSPEMNRLSGPLDFEEVEEFKKLDWVPEDFRKESIGADSYWWYIQGNEQNGSQGIIALKGCTIIANQFVDLWILDDIAMLHNKRFKVDSGIGYAILNFQLIH
ncbi:MAG: hypothetical protein ABJ387_06655 [Balneola sp.]